MNIELKNIHYSPTLSDDSNAFTANLYINGKKVCMVRDNGNGGGLDYGIVDPTLRPPLNEAEQWCKQLPPVISPLSPDDDKPSYLEMDLELYIDDLLMKYFQRLEERKFERKMADTFLYGTSAEHYGTIKFRYSFQHMMGLPDGREKITAMLRKHILPKIAKGYRLLNTNIPEEIILAAGLKEGQYVQPKPAKQAEKKKAQRQGPKP